MKTCFAILAVVALVAPGAAFLAFGREAGARSAHAARATRIITIDNFTFGADKVTVDRGTEVTWVNRDDMPHTVVSTAKAFASEALDTDQTFTHTFAEAGTFDYFCSIHPRMTGRVVVEK